MPEAKAGRPKPPPRERLLRSLVALLMTPFLLLTVLLIGCWLQASGKLSVHRRMVSSVWATWANAEAAHNRALAIR